MSFAKLFAEAETWFVDGHPMPMLGGDAIRSRMSDELHKRWHAMAYDLEQLEVPAHDPARLGERFVIFSFIHELIDYGPFLPPSQEEDRVETALSFFREAIALVEPEDCTSTRQCQLELRVAARIGDWGRVKRLCEHWIQLAPRETDDALRALARTYFMSAHPGMAGLDGSGGDWMQVAAVMEGPFEAFMPFILTSFALVVEEEVRIDYPWQNPSDIPLDAVCRTIDAAAALQRVESRKSGLDVVHSSVMAWCRFVEGRRNNDTAMLLDAASRYASLLDQDWETQARFGVERSMKNRALSAGARCFQWGRDSRRAKDLVAEWVKAVPEDHFAWKRLAEIHAELWEYDESCSAYAEAVRLNPDEEESFQDTLILKLWGENATTDKIVRAIESRAASDDKRDFGMALIDREWSTYGKLDTQARERWWVGVLLLTDRGEQHDIGPSAVMIASAQLGAAVAIELRRRVFGPLKTSAEIRTLKEDVGDQLDSRARRLLSDLEGDRLTLGGMILWLCLSVEAKEHPFGAALDRWLVANRCALRSEIGRIDTRKALRDLPEFRNAAAHATLDIRRAETLFASAHSFLDALVG